MSKIFDSLKVGNEEIYRKVIMQDRIDDKIIFFLKEYYKHK